MLTLLLKTRFRIYRNYIRHHFDRVTVLEISIIIFIFLLLLARSPADIGYNMRFLRSENFTPTYLRLFPLLIICFYVISEFMAIITRKRESDWKILGTLPFRRNEIIHFYLIRHFLKIAPLFLILAMLFWAGTGMSILQKASQFVAASGFLILLQVISFWQANVFQQPNRWRWLLRELSLLMILMSGVYFLPAVLGNLIYCWITIPFLLIADCLLLKNLYASFHPASDKIKIIKKSTHSNQYHYFTIPLSHRCGPLTRLLWRDFTCLWRRQRSVFMWPIFGTLVMLINVSAAKQSTEAGFGNVVIQSIFGIFIINSLLKVYEADAGHFHLDRSLPISPRRIWWARWLMTGIIIASQWIVPALVLLLKFHPDLNFVLFSAAGLILIPAILATIQCNAAFSLFPHIKYSGLIIMLSIVLIILFWFFMPFGSVIILLTLVYWIRKSQRNFKSKEIE